MSILLAPRHRTLQRRLRGSGAHPAVRVWMFAWLGGPAIGISNGLTRELAYKERVGELTAHQISTATGSSATTTTWPTGAYGRSSWPGLRSARLPFGNFGAAE